jgi:hypothetical protein
MMPLALSSTATVSNLLGLRGMWFGDPGVRFELALPIPPWGWALIVAAAFAVSFWSYWHLAAPRVPRYILATLRGLVLVLVAFLLSGPRLVKQEDRTEPDVVAMLVDRSASLGVADAPGVGGAGGAGSMTSREAQLRAALTGAGVSLRQLGIDRRVLWLGFGDAVTDLPVTDGPLPVGLTDPTAMRSDVGPAIEAALKRLAARPTAGIVLFSDGRASSPIDPALVRKLQAEKIAVFAVPLGSERPLDDLAIARVQAPTLAFAGDLVPITVDIARRGGSVPGAVVKAELVDGGGSVLDTQTVKIDPDGTAPVTLTTRPEGAMRGTWTVRVTSDLPELSTSNNSQGVSIEVSDQPIRVLYVDGTPRWEYRYLKNLLVREASIRSSVLILAPDRRFIQEGSDPLMALPQTQEEWNKFDVVIMGDVRPELLSSSQQDQLRDVVSRRGTGLLWIAGPNATPQRWRTTPLADLLPFAAGASDSESAALPLRVWLEPVTLRSEPAAQRLGVLALDEPPSTKWPEAVSNPASGWSQLKWMQRIDRAALKPTAEVLAIALPLSGNAEPSPALITMRYGAGRSMYFASDETWRWRYGRGETLQERFWLPLIRLLARDSLGRVGKPALLDASPAQVPVGQSVRLTLRILDQALADRAPKAIPVRIRLSEPSGINRADGLSTLDLMRDRAEAGAIATWSALWPTTLPGTFVIEPRTPLLDGLDLATQADVVADADELRRPQADHVLLAQLAKDTGGAVIAADQLETLPKMLPNRAVRMLGPAEIQTLWDTPLSLTLLLVLLTLEWAGRRLVKLS